MATAEVIKLPGLPEQQIPPPEKAELNAPIEKAIEPSRLPFDPAELKEKYLTERDKRLRPEGVDQYRLIDGDNSHYLKDPWTKPGFTRDPVDEEVNVVIVGGGYGAQLVAVRLIEAGVTNIRMIEKAGNFGGTWYWNRYPGAQCDIESYIYMPLIEELGFMPTEKYARAAELLRHSELIGEKWGLYEKALFQTEVKAMRWNQDSLRWSVETSWNDKISARFIVPAAGPLHRPKLPGLTGIESFKGHSFHSSRWDFDYTGGDPSGGLTKLGDKRIGIIGTGATAVQIVPNLGKWAKQVYVFQRTPSSIDLRGNKPTDPAWSQSLEKGWQKKRMDNFNIIVNGGDEPEDMVQDGWTDILKMLLVRAKEGEVLDPETQAADRQLADFKKMESIRARVDAIVKDPETAESLKPYYNQFCKRPCFHDEYLPTFNRPNVQLVDTKGAGVQAITEKGIVANGKEFEVDCIIYATGFELATDWSHRTGMEIYGRNGLPTSEAWKEGHRTLHGWTSPGYPNCFWISIVQAALTPNFVHVTSEQAKHIAYVIGKCMKQDIKTVESSEKAADEWVETIVEMAKLRADFGKDCTPGYYNNEGKSSDIAQRNAAYGGGSPAFLQIMETWRGKDDLEGLDVDK